MGTEQRSPTELFPLINDVGQLDQQRFTVGAALCNYRPQVDLDSNNSTSFGEDYRANVISGGPV